MDDNEINNINQKLNKLIEKNELLEKENKDIKVRLIKAEDNIKNLNKQQKFMRIEYKKIFQELEEKYITLLENKFKKILQNENKHEENEIIIDEKQNNNEELLNIKIVNELIQKSVTGKFNEIQNNIWDLFGQKKDNKINENKEIKIDPKKEKIINENIQKFENYISKIYNDKEEKIPKHYLNDLKKVTKALLIQGKDPFVIGSELFKKLEINLERNDENVVKSCSIKKINIMNELYNILNGFKNIIIHDDNDKEFKTKFREKYGITEKDINDKNLDKLIKKNKGKEKHIIKELLMNLKYII